MGMGYVNVVLMIFVLFYCSKLDFLYIYFVIVGIVGIDLGQGMVGLVVWVWYVVDYGFLYEIDVCEMLVGWLYGYFGIGIKGFGEKLLMDYCIEVFQFNEMLLQKVYMLLKLVMLEDGFEVIVFCKNYVYVLVNQLFVVIQCDVVFVDIWWVGCNFGQWVCDWVKMMIDNKGIYCMIVQEDNVMLEVLMCGVCVGKIDFSCVVLLCVGFDFDCLYDG